MNSTEMTVEIGNGQRETRTLIGTVTVEEFVHRTSEQTACNWREITVPAGTYDVWLDSRGYWAHIRFPGVKTDEYFVNRLFTASSVAEKRGIGEPEVAHRQMYGYDVAQKFATDAAWVLAEDWRVEMKTWFDGGGLARKSYSLKHEGGA